MEKRMDNKVAIVTGGTSGIGRGIAVLLAKEGAKIVVAGRNSQAGSEVVREISDLGGQAVFVRTDITKESDCQRLINTAVDSYGTVDVLVNNAGIFPRSEILETTEELWDRVMAVNLKGAFFCCKHVIPVMKEQKKGAIVNIGSTHAWGARRPDIFAYSISKGGLLTLTKNLAKAYAQDHIRVNWITVGWVMTPGEIATTQEQEGKDKNWLREQGKDLPMGRFQTPEDIAYTVLYLASDESSQVTGAEIPVTGGWFM